MKIFNLLVLTRIKGFKRKLQSMILLIMHTIYDETFSKVHWKSNEHRERENPPITTTAIMSNELKPHDDEL